MPRRFSRIVAITLLLVGGLLAYAFTTDRLTVVTRLIWHAPAGDEGGEGPAVASGTPARDGTLSDSPATPRAPVLAMPQPDIAPDTAVDPATAAPLPGITPAPVVVALVTPAPADTARPEVPAAPSSDEAAAATAEVDALAHAGAPALDLVRVTADGNAVVSGSTLPGAEVELLMDGVTVGRGVADRRGDFVIVTELGPLDTPRALQVRVAGGPEETPEGTTAEDQGAPATVAVAVEGGSAPEAPEPDRAARLLSAPVVILPPEIDGAQVAGVAPPAPTLVETGADGLALKTPADAPVERMTLDAVSYNAAGDAVARGRAPAGTRIRVFVNNRALAETTAPESGEWVARLPENEAQAARLLRFDQIGPNDEVLHRLETRFDYARELGDLTVSRRSILVERGDSLWRIAENIYGDGLRYSVIFSANADLIRDPDLIYPEQEFFVPELSPDPPGPEEDAAAGVAGGE